jgi:hypothetical protein
VVGGLGAGLLDELGGRSSSNVTMVASPNRIGSRPDRAAMVEPVLDFSTMPSTIWRGQGDIASC